MAVWRAAGLRCGSSARASAARAAEPIAMSAVVSVSWVIGCWAKDYERYLLLQGRLKVVLNRLGISNLLGLRPFAYRLEGPLDPNRACHTRSIGVEAASLALAREAIVADHLVLANDTAHGGTSSPGEQAASAHDG
jgi:hypothetical protein